MKGVGYVGARAQPVAEVPFLPYARSYVRDLTGITPATRHRYDRQVLALDQQLRPIVGEDVTVANVEEVHVRRWVNAREAAGARPKTIANYHGLLYMILAAAVRAGLRPGNPCAGTRLPDRYSPDATGDRDAVFLTETQFALVARAMFPTSDSPVAGRGRPGRRPRSAAGKHAGTVEDRWLVEAAVGTGLRWSELTALQVQDLELNAPVARLSVKCAWKRNPLGEFTVAGAGAFYLGKPKSKKSRRRITLSPAVVTVLRRGDEGQSARRPRLHGPAGRRAEPGDRVRGPLAGPHCPGRGTRTHRRTPVPRPAANRRRLADHRRRPIAGHPTTSGTRVDHHHRGHLRRAAPAAHEVADAAINAALAGRPIPPPAPAVTTGTVVGAADQDVTYDPVLDAGLGDDGDDVIDEP